jgi:crossover junction endodeoxyribonuclease RusA
MSAHTLPYPPSVNSIWRNIVVGGRARTVLSREGREYRAQVHAGLAGCKPVPGPVAVELRVYRPRRIGDLDNTAKAVLDAIKGRLFGDDSEVVELLMVRNDDRARPRVEVVVRTVVFIDPAVELHNRHTDDCLLNLADPGASCVCRPPVVAEPLVGVPTPNVRRSR